MQQIGNRRSLRFMCFGLIAFLAPVGRAQAQVATDPAPTTTSATLQQQLPPVAPPASLPTPDAGGADSAARPNASVTPPNNDAHTTSVAPAATAGTNSAAAMDQQGTEQGKPKKAKKGKRKQRQLSVANAPSDLILGDPWGDTQDELRIAGLAFRFLVQTHYRHTLAEPSQNSDESYRLPENTLARDGDGWSLNRFFFRIIANPSRYLSLRLITDFAEFRHSNSKKAVKQAFVELKPIPSHLHFQVGVLKLPFSTLELDPVAKHEFTYLGEANDLITRLGFAGRDVGAQVTAAPLAKPKYLEFVAGVYAGHAKDENRSLVGAVGARVVSRAVKDFRFGIDCVAHPSSTTYLNPFDTASKDLLPNPDNPNYPRSRTWTNGQAYSADVTFSRAGLMVRGEAMIGTRVDYDTRYGAEHWGAVWGLAAYRFPAGPIRLQPAVRAEFLDSDWEHKAGLRRQLSFALATYFSDATRLLLDLTRTDVQQNTLVLDQPEPLREVPYGALNNTRVTAQLQVDL